jgi:ribose transport system ATP-binding protein
VSDNPVTPSSDKSPRLLVRGAGKSFAGHPVLADIDLTVYPGEVFAVIGENGAGKSTLSAIIAGLIQPDSGEMTFENKPYAPASPGEALHAGVGLIHQELRLLPDLSIAENIFVGHLPGKRFFVDREEMNRRAAEQLRRLGLELAPSRLVRTLRVAAQQLVEIAKALLPEMPSFSFSMSQLRRLAEKRPNGSSARLISSEGKE